MAIKELYLFGASELTAFDRTVRVTLKTGVVHKFSESNDRWTRSEITAKQLILSNATTYNILVDIFS